MPKYVYIGGTTRSEHSSETSDDRGQTTTIDERNGVDMPDSTTAFGIKFVIDRPTDVLPQMFPNANAYQHAVKKLGTNQFFRPYAEEVPFVEVKADPAPVAERKKPGPKPKAKAVEDDPSELADDAA